MSNQEQEQKCEFPHNDKKMIMQQPKKLVTNDEFPCPKCNQTLYITIERANGNDLLNIDIMWWLTVSDKPIEVEK